MQSNPIKNPRLAIFSVFFAFGMDFLSWSIVFPLFAPYFLHPNSPIFSPEVSQSTKTAVLGLFLAAFSLGQLVGAPILGEYGDRCGRRKALVGSIFFTFVGLSITALGMQFAQLTILFMGRLLSGIFSCSTSICMACLSDLYHDEELKMRRYSLLSFVAGSSFVLGAFLGGNLSDSGVVSWFAPNVPLWIAAGLSGLNFLFVFRSFPETRQLFFHGSFHFFSAFHPIFDALKAVNIQLVYGVYFFFLFGWTILFQLIPVVLVENFSFSSASLGNLALFMGGSWALGSASYRLFASKIQFLHLLQYAFFFYTLLCGWIGFVQGLSMTLFLLGACVFLGGLIWPICTGLISRVSPSQIQGKAFGLSQAVQSFSMTLAPIIGGFAFYRSDTLPFLLASLAGLIAMGLYFLLKDRLSSPNL